MGACKPTSPLPTIFYEKLKELAGNKRRVASLGPEEGRLCHMGRGGRSRVHVLVLGRETRVGGKLRTGVAGIQRG